MKDLVDREEEFELVEGLIRDNSFRFFSVMGRRRVGKTELMKSFLEDTQGFYFYVPLGDSLQIRLRYAEKLSDRLDVSFVGRPSWRVIFEEMFEASTEEQFLVVFDEFQRFLKVDDSVPLILQEMIDKYKDDSKMALGVVGSSIGMMNSMFDSSAPLYGRRTDQIWLDPLKFQYASEFIEGSLKDKVQYYSVFGGTPKYLEFIENDKSLEGNIEDNILSDNSILYDEPEALLSTELDSPEEYLEILRLISQGKQTPKQITDNIEIEKTSFSYYAKNLIERLGLLEKEVPATEKPGKSRNTHYKIKDNFFNFYFRFVYPQRDQLELDNQEGVKKKIMSELNSYTGRVFEDIVLDWIRTKNGDKGLETYERIGRWWNRQGQELDICGTKKDGALLGEIKFSEVGHSTAEKLDQKIKNTEHFDNINQKVIVGVEITAEAKEYLENEEILYFELEDISQK